MEGDVDVLRDDDAERLSRREVKKVLRKDIAVRRETFGGTMYNKKLLRYSYVGHTMTEVLERDDAVEVWKNDVSDVPEGILAAPTRVYYELTRDCNLRCRHCFNSSGKVEDDQQSTGEVLLTLDGLRNDAVFDVRFTGGELTRRPDWFEILAYAVEQGFAVSCNTNCVYDDDSIVNAFSDLAGAGMSQITTSIDGNREVHDWLRGRGSYDRSVASLRAMKGLGVPLRINTLLFKDTIPHIESVLDLAAETCEEVNFFYARPFGRAASLDAHMVESGELWTASKKIEELRDNYNGLSVLHGVQVIQDNSVQGDFGLRVGGPDGFTRFNVNSDGSIWAGGYSEHISGMLCLGSMDSENYSVTDIWRHSPKLELLRTMSERQQVKCNDCSDRYKSCGGFDLEMVLANDMRYCPTLQ